MTVQSTLTRTHSNSLSSGRKKEGMGNRGYYYIVTYRSYYHASHSTRLYYNMLFISKSSKFWQICTSKMIPKIYMCMSKTYGHSYILYELYVWGESSIHLFELNGKPITASIPTRSFDGTDKNKTKVHQEAPQRVSLKIETRVISTIKLFFHKVL